MLRPMLDRLTLVAIAVLAYAAANIAHEAVGHGGACLAVGGRPVAVSAVHFEGDLDGLPGAAQRWQSAGGTLVNLALGLLCLALLRRGSGATPARYFLWLLATLNLLQASGYWLFSGIGGIGDWARVVEGLEPAWAWRLGLAVLGGGAYWAVVVLSLREMLPFLGAQADRLRRASTLVLVPYFAGGLLYVAAGLLNPHGFRLVVISAAAASFGGASAFAWMTQLLRNTRAYPPSPDPALVLPASGRWQVAGLLVAALFVLVLGPSLSF
jgi:hypothetical protein